MYMSLFISLLRYSPKIDSVYLFKRQVQFQYSHSHRVTKISLRYTRHSKSADPTVKRIIAPAFL